MGRTIRLHDEKHWALQSLLPGYAAGRLAAEDRSRVEVHLKSCEECREELRLEQILARTVTELSLNGEPRRRARGRARGRAWAGWAVGACVLLAAALALLPHQPFGQPRLLGASPTAAPGDMVVVFRPDLRERDIRAALEAADARIVDGPTASDAYVLSAPIAQRAAALAKLRARHGVVMAETVDPAPTP